MLKRKKLHKMKFQYYQNIKRNDLYKQENRIHINVKNLI